MDTLMHEDRCKNEGVAGEKKDHRSQMEWRTMAQQSQKREDEENDACWRSDRSFSPLLLASIWGVQLHTRAHVHSFPTRRLRLDY